jgi:hypothetical protein
VAAPTYIPCIRATAKGLLQGVGRSRHEIETDTKSGEPTHVFASTRSVSPRCLQPQDAGCSDIVSRQDSRLYHNWQRECVESAFSGRSTRPRRTSIPPRAGAEVALFKLRYASGEAARLSIGREGFDLPTERQFCLSRSSLGFRFALALDIRAVGALVALNVFELPLPVAHGIKLRALGAAMRGPLGHI